MGKLTLLILATMFSIQGVAADLSLKLGRTFMFDGVNCHSASLQAAGILKYPTYVTDEEIRFIFESQCTETQRNEKHSIGITGAGTIFSHSFFYLEPNKIFQKSSLQKKTTYEVRRRGPIRSAKYYTCEAEPKDCSDERVIRLQRKTDEVGLYYAGLLVSADNMKQRDARQKQLVALQRETNSLRELPRSCKRALKRMMYRQDSLRAVADRLSGAQFYLNQLPRGVGRD